MNERPIVLSGVQPSGSLHLGNYIGAIGQWKALQAAYKCYFCVVDLHALTTPGFSRDLDLRGKSRDIAALYLACGIDADESTIFVQSDVSAHSELMWILLSSTSLGALERMTQYKSKTEQSDRSAGLLTYPVLQAADILLYGTNAVPVGADQKQHIELTRDLAQRFNARFGETFVLPEVMIPPAGARIMGLDDPTVKMSKSTGRDNPNHLIDLMDSPDIVRRKYGRAVTDSKSAIDPNDLSPGVQNLMEILAALTGQEVDDVAQTLAGSNYGRLKSEVTEATNATLAPIHHVYSEIRADEGRLDSLLALGAERAGARAEQTMLRVRKAIGLS